MTIAFDTLPVCINVYKIYRKRDEKRESIMLKLMGTNHFKCSERGGIESAFFVSSMEN